MEFVDDRTPEQKKSHTFIVMATDLFISNKGFSRGGASYAGWACLPEHADTVYKWVKGRTDMTRVRTVGANYKPNPTFCAHCHIYVVTEEHPALHEEN